MTAYDDIPYSDATTYFMDDGEVAGDNWTMRKWTEEEGKTVLATTDKATWMKYCTMPESFWKIEGGQFVKVHPETDITLYTGYQTQLAEKQKSLAETQDAFQQHADGYLTDEQYEPTRLIRVQLYTDIATLKAQIEAMEEK